MPINRRYAANGLTSLRRAGAPFGPPIILNKSLRINILSITHLAAIFYGHNFQATICFQYFADYFGEGGKVCPGRADLQVRV